MIIQQKTGTLQQIKPGDRQVEQIGLEWYETGKKILHKRTDAGRAVVLKLLNEAAPLQQDDVVYMDDALLIAIRILPAEAIVLQPATLHEMAMACYEIGNKHLPLFYQDGILTMPYDTPVFNQLLKAGYQPQKENRQLLYPLKTSVMAHRHTGSSLFSKILQLTNSPDAS